MYCRYLESIDAPTTDYNIEKFLAWFNSRDDDEDDLGDIRPIGGGISNRSS